MIHSPLSIPHRRFSSAWLAAATLLGVLASPLHAVPGYLLLGSTWGQSPKASLCVVNTATGLATLATLATGAVFSANLSGPAGRTVFLEASTDLGKSDAWQGIGQTVLEGSGNGTFNALPDPGTAGNLPAPTDFFRLRMH